MSERRRYPPDASEVRGTGRAQRGAAEPRGEKRSMAERRAAERAWRGYGESSSAHTPSIADGTAEMHRGRVGSRHFEAPCVL